MRKKREPVVKLLDCKGIKSLRITRVGPNGYKEVLTPYGLKTLKRRRAANKVAKQARKVNRGRR